MADEGIEIPVNLDINDAEREMAKLQKEIGRTKVRLQVEIGKKGELQKKLAENAAKADVIQIEGSGSPADLEALRQSEMEWTSINKQIREADAAIGAYNARIAAATAEYQRLAQESASSAAAQGAAAKVPDELKTKLAFAKKQLADLAENGVKSGAIELPVDVDLKQAKKRIEQLKKKAESDKIKLEAAVADETDWKRLLKNNKAAQSRIAKAQEQNGSLTPAQETRSARLAEEQDYILSKIRECQKEQLKYTEAVRQTTAEYQRMQSAVSNIENVSIGDRIKSSLSGAFESLKNLPSKGLDWLKNLPLSALEKLGSLAKKAGAGLKSLAGGAIKKGFTSLGSSIKNAAKSFLGLDKNSRKANGGLASGLFTVIKYAFGIRSLYMLVRKLKTALVDGFKNLAQFSTQTNADISMVMSALTQLKNSLATAFAPILTVIAPLVTKFINMMSAAATAVARLTAQLTGKTSFVKATSVQQDYAKSLDKTAGAAGSAADAAKEANKTLASFDEINKLDAPSSGSGGGGSGGGGGGAGVGDMFTTEQIEPLNFDSWGAAFSAFLDKLINDGIPMLKNALTSLAGWINDFAANLAEMFTFPGVEEKVILLGTEVGQALNDFVSQINWDDIGTALGAGFNLALEFLVNAVLTFDFLALGANLATMVNNAVEQINWYDLGQLLFKKMSMMWETAAGFLLNLDMPLLAQSASHVVMGYLDAASETISNIDWAGLVHQAFEFIRNVDWWGLICSLFKFVSSLLSSAWEIILTVLFELVISIFDVVDGAIETVSEWIHGAFIENGEFSIGGFLKGILNGLLGIGRWINQHVFQPIIKAFKTAFGIASPSKKMAELGNFMTEGLLQGVKQKISAIIQTFSGLWSSIKGVFGSVSSWFSNTFSGAWQAVKDVFSTGGEIFEGIKEGILSGLKSVVNALIRGINKVIAVPFNGLNSALRSIKRVSILGLKPFSWLPTISVPQIPQLAQGAVIPPNKEFLAVLGDQKNGTNIETPLSTMVQAFKQALNENGGSGDVYIYLDSEQIAARVEKRQRQKAIRTNGAVKSYA